LSGYGDRRAYNFTISMYDDICRFLAENFSTDFASWLLGKSVTLTELQSSELSLDPIRADALIFLESDETILHIEFQTLPKDNIPFRLLDYRVRMYRKDPTKSMRQVVIYLKQTGSELAYQTSFTMERTRHEFDVIRLWEQPATLFLQYPGLIPFAVLGQNVDAEEALRQASQRVDRISDPQTKANLLAKPVRQHIGSVRDSGGVKIRTRSNLSSIAKRHHARIHCLSFNTGRGKSRETTGDRPQLSPRRLSDRNGCSWNGLINRANPAASAAVERVRAKSKLVTIR
jgi:hypothetical protein